MGPRRVSLAIGLLAATGALVPGTVLAQEEPPADDGVTVDEGVVAGTTPGTLPLVPVPLGCAAPDSPDVVFLGEVAATDDRTVRFTDVTVRAGELGSFDRGGLVDVRFGYDAQYLDPGERFLVGAEIDPDIGILVSKLAPEPINFAGDEIIGVSEDDVICPDFEDPILTLTPIGMEVETGLLDNLVEDRTRLAATVVVPFAIVVAVIFLLALLRVSAAGFLRSLRRR